MTSASEISILFLRCIRHNLIRQREMNANARRRCHRVTATCVTAFILVAKYVGFQTVLKVPFGTRIQKLSSKLHLHQRASITVTRVDQCRQRKCLAQHRLHLLHTTPKTIQTTAIVPTPQMLASHQRKGDAIFSPTPQMLASHQRKGDAISNIKSRRHE